LQKHSPKNRHPHPKADDPATPTRVCPQYEKAVLTPEANRSVFPSTNPSRGHDLISHWRWGASARQRPDVDPASTGSAQPSTAPADQARHRRQLLLHDAYNMRTRTSHLLRPADLTLPQRTWFSIFPVLLPTRGLGQSRGRTKSQYAHQVIIDPKSKLAQIKGAPRSQPTHHTNPPENRRWLAWSAYCKGRRYHSKLSRDLSTNIRSSVQWHRSARPTTLRLAPFFLR